MDACRTQMTQLFHLVRNLAPARDDVPMQSRATSATTFVQSQTISLLDGARKSIRKTAQSCVMTGGKIYIVEITALLPDIKKKMPKTLTISSAR